MSRRSRLHSTASTRAAARQQNTSVSEIGVELGHVRCRITAFFEPRALRRDAADDSATGRAEGSHAVGDRHRLSGFPVRQGGPEVTRSRGTTDRDLRRVVWRAEFQQQVANEAASVPRQLAGVPVPRTGLSRCERRPQNAPRRLSDRRRSHHFCSASRPSRGGVGTCIPSRGTSSSAYASPAAAGAHRAEACALGEPQSRAPRHQHCGPRRVGPKLGVGSGVSTKPDVARALARVSQRCRRSADTCVRNPCVLRARHLRQPTTTSD